MKIKHNLVTALFLLSFITYPYFVLYGSQGISRALWGLAFIVLVEVAKYSSGIKYNYRQYLGLPLIIATSLVWFVRGDDSILAVNHLLAPFSALLHIGIACDSLKIKYLEDGNIIQYIKRRLQTSYANPIQLELKQNLTGTGIKEALLKLSKNLYKIVLGCFGALMIGGAVLLLLSSADEVFASRVSSIFGSFIDLGLYLKFAFSFILMFITWAVAKGGMLDGAKEEVITPIRQRYDVIIFGFIIFTLNAIYLLFSIVQLDYLFRGEDFAIRNKIIFSEYAVRGFWEMICVVLINLGITALVALFIDIKSGIQKKLLRNGLLFMNVASLLMIYSAHIRLATYENAYGYTGNRLIPHLATLILAIVCMALMVALFVKAVKARRQVVFHSIWWGVNISVISLILLPFGVISLQLNNIKADNDKSWELDICYIYKMRSSSYENMAFIDSKKLIEYNKSESNKCRAYGPNYSSDDNSNGWRSTTIWNLVDPAR